MNPSIDEELLLLVERVLVGAGYAVRVASAADVPYVLAEDRDNILAVTALLEAGMISSVEPAIASALLEHIKSADAGAKRWDAYVVLLTSARTEDEATRDLFDLAYNLIQVRRIVRIDVKPTIADVSRALRGVLPLASSAAEGVLDDPLASLAARLEGGLGHATVSAAIESFRVHDEASASHAESLLKSDDAVSETNSDDDDV